MSAIVVFALPLHGHMPAVLRLTAELSTRGRSVICYSSRAFAPAVRETGAAWRGYPSPLLEDLSYTPDFCWRLMACAKSILQRELSVLRDDRPSAILYDAMLPWGPAVRDLLAVPAASVIANFVFHGPVREMLRHTRIAPRSIVDLMAGCQARANAGEITEELRAEFGVTVQDGGGVPFPDDRLNLVFTSRVLQPFAELLDHRYVFAGPALPAPNRSDEPAVQGLGTRRLVFISFGTVFNADRELFETCFDALMPLDCEAVASTGRAYTAADFPRAGHIRIVPFVRQAAVFERATITITHGGMITSCESLSWGVPMILIPATEEQEILASRIEELGCGIHIPRQDVSTERLSDAVRCLFSDPTYRDRCKTVAESLRQAGGAALAADRIGALLA
jgi:MGT family glycosyltransferase